MDPDQRRRFLGNIHQEANRIQEITDRMLELSALETRKQISEWETVSLAAMLKSVLEGKRALLTQKKITLTATVPEDLFVRGDSLLLSQAVANLLQNAIDFSPKFGAITISGQADPKAARLSITDNGSGIPDYAREKIFNKFFSLQRPDTGRKSTGLGLNFVKETAELHFGAVALENRPQGGVRASLTLPL
jgi:two-component system, OmpR family, sensor histidine kinase CreC